MTTRLPHRNEKYKTFLTPSSLLFLLIYRLRFRINFFFPCLSFFLLSSFPPLLLITCMYASIFDTCLLICDYSFLKWASGIFSNSSLSSISLLPLSLSFSKAPLSFLSLCLFRRLLSPSSLFISCSGSSLLPLSLSLAQAPLSFLCPCLPLRLLSPSSLFVFF